MKKMWIVYAEPPKSMLGSAAWPWPDDYFPRKMYYKKDAITLANLAKENNGTNVRVEQEK